MRLLATLFLFFLVTKISAQQTYETFTPANGLVDARVSGMVQDKYGRLIIYTREGFSIYDGQRFKNYLTIDKEEIGIITGSIILPDNTLYLVRFSGSPVKVEKDKVSYDKKFLDSVKEISAINKINDSTHLLLTNYGTYLLSNTRLKKIINKDNQRPYEITYSSSGAIYGNKLLLYLYNEKSEPALVLYDFTQEKITDKIENIILNTIVQDKKNNIYVCSNNEIYIIDLSKLNEDKITYSKSNLLKNVPDKGTSFLLTFDNDNNPWILYSGQGCYKINRFSGEQTLYSYANGLLKSISGFFQDKEKNYWFMSHGKGLQKLVQSNYREVQEVNTKQYNSGRFMFTMPDGNLFINRSGKQFIIEDEKSSEISSGMAEDSLLYWQNRLWHFKNRNTLESSGFVSIQFGLKEDGSPMSLSSKIKTDNKGNLLIAGNVFYLLKKNGEYATFELPYFTDNIATDNNGDYWAFCRAIYKTIQIREINGRLVKIKEYDTPLFTPRCAVHWNRDTFLVGTRNNGLYFAKVKEQEIVPVATITRDRGLSNNFVLDMVKIGMNKLALGTASGVNIISFNNDDTTIQNISSAIDIYDPISNLAVDKSGILYALSETTGLLYKYSSQQQTNIDYQPKAYINALFVNRQKIDLSKNKFSFNENNLLFEVAAPSFIDNKNIKFNFSLEGNTNIHSINSNGNLELNNLKPGSYELKIKVIFPGKNYPDQIIRYSFIIKNPFWKTWWFLILTIVTLSFISWIIVRNYYDRKLEKAKSLLEKELAIEQERSKMARELHDGLGSMLSGVKHSFSAMANQMHLNQEEETLFHSNIEKLNETIKELRTISHSLASESLLKFGLQNSLHDFCRNLNLAGLPKIKFSALNMEEAPLTEEQTFHIFRIAQELLTNMAKHAEATEAILQISYNAGVIYLTAEDNGKGFKPDEVKKKEGLGLKNIESRVRILKGKLDFQSAPFKGTSVMIEIPCKG